MGENMPFTFFFFFLGLPGRTVCPWRTGNFPRGEMVFSFSLPLKAKPAAHRGDRWKVEFMGPHYIPLELTAVGITLVASLLH